MNKMKNIWINSALLAVAGMSAASCSDFLDIYPLTMVYEDNFWDEKNDVEQVVTGCYTRMQDDDFVRRLFIWGESRSDNTRGAGGFHEGYSRTSAEGYILNENILSTNVYTDWSSFYAVINRCNLVIQKVPEVAERDPSYLQSERNATIAEVSALRALCYFYLVRTFKNVPYYTDAITDDEHPLAIPVTDGDSIVKTLIADLENVLNSAREAWPRQGRVDVSYGRITRNAIRALLADMCLWIGDYAKAAEYAKQAYEAKKDYFEENRAWRLVHDTIPLVPDNDGLSPEGEAYRSNFVEGGGPESLFELDFSNNESDKWNDAIAEFYFRKVNRGSGTGAGLFAPSEGLWSEYTAPELFLKSNDTRIRESMAADDESNPQRVTIAKYVQVYMGPNAAQKHITQGTKNDANWIFYRVSDVMLIRAEALVCMMSDNKDLTEEDIRLKTEAFNLVKAVADRSAERTESGLSMESFVSKDQMTDLVFDERRREFLFEGKRWFDLVRRSRREGNTDYLIEKVKEKFTENAAVATGKLRNMDAIYFPYNYDELQVNPNITQNPAYPEVGDSYESTN